MLPHHGPLVVAEQFAPWSRCTRAALTDPLRSYELIAELSLDRAEV